MIDMQSKYYNWIGALILIGLLAIVVYLIMKNRQTNQTVPEILITELTKVINPIGQVESYVVEGEGVQYTDTDLSRKVNIEISWKNKGGFEGLKTIRFVRSVVTDESTTATVLEDVVVKNSDVNKIYFTSFANASYKFTTIPDGLSCVGKNIINIYYYFTDDITVNTAITNQTLKLTTNDVSVNVSRSDIILTLSITASITVDFTPWGNDFSQVIDYLGEGYFLHPKNSRLYSLQSRIGKEYAERKIILTATDDPDSDTAIVEIKILASDGLRKIPLYVDTNDNLVPYTSGDVSSITRNKFNLVKNEALSAAAIRDTASATNPVQGVFKIKLNGENKYVTISEGSIPYMRSTTDINDKETWESMDMYFYKQQNILDAPCVYTKTVGTCQTAENPTATCNNISLKRGQRCNTYKISKDATGSGTCAYTEGQQVMETCPVNCEWKATGLAKTGSTCKKCWAQPDEKSLPEAYTKLDSINGGTCTAPEPKTYIACNNKACENCPTILSKSDCGIDKATGKGWKLYSYNYNTTGENEGCYQQGAPPPAYTHDTDCQNARACTVSKTPGTCSDTTYNHRNYTWSTSNPDGLTNCPAVPASGSEYDEACENRTRGYIPCSLGMNVADFCNTAYCTGTQWPGAYQCVNKHADPNQQQQAMKATDKVDCSSKSTTVYTMSGANTRTLIADGYGFCKFP